MFKCFCGKSFDKRANYGRHLTVHKNRDHIGNEEYTEVHFEKGNDDLSQDNDDLNREDFMSHDDDDLNREDFMSHDDDDLNREDFMSHDGDISDDNLDEVSDVSENSSFKENMPYKSK